MPDDVKKAAVVIDDSKVNISKKSARIIGAAVIMLALVGIVSIACSVVAAVNHADNKERLSRIAEIEDYIAPVVAINPPDFSSGNELDNNALLRSAAVYVIRNSGDTLKTSADGRVMIPIKTIQPAVSALYGDSVKVKYTSFDINGLLFEYDRSLESYCFYASGHAERYLPKIVDYIEKDGVITAQVKYEAAVSSDASEGLKYTYKIAVNDDSMSILSIKKQ